MKLSIGIVGLPNVGKSTLFKILTKQEVNIANYPFVTIDPNVGVVPVPDERLEKLAALNRSKNKIPAAVEFYDIAGLVKGAYKGEGLGNQFLSHIRETQAIVIVLRAFKDEDIVHIEKTVDPIRDMETITTELVFKDLETVSKRLSKLESEAKTGRKDSIKDFEILKKVSDALNKNELALKFRDEEIVKELQLLTAKKQIYLINGEDGDVSAEIFKKIKGLGADYIIANLSKIEALPELIKQSHEILGLITFFTFNENETRAWTIEKGTKAPQAAGVIHTDFEKNFIRAEVVSYSKLVKAGSWLEAKQKGWIRLEGKDYEVKDDDVLLIRHG